MNPTSSFTFELCSRRTMNVVRRIATRPALNAAATACYIIAVVMLIHAIALHVRLDRAAAPDLATARGAATATGACADATGLERTVCNADARFDATRAKIKRHLTKRKLQDVTPVAVPLVLPERPDLTLSFVGDTLVWTAERADLPHRSRGSALEAAPHRADGMAKPGMRSNATLPSLAGR